MPTRSLSNELAQEAIDLVSKHGGVVQAAKAVGMPHRRLHWRYRVALQRGFSPQITREFGTRGSHGQTVLVIPDLHCPYQHPDAFEFIKAAKKKFSPSRAMCMGDEADQHAMCQYHPDPDNHSPGKELDLAKECLSILADIFPVLPICHSNHGDRYLKTAARNNLPRQVMKRYQEIYESPIGWQWADKWEIDGVVYEHGEGVNGPDGARRKAMYNMKPTVIGHLHAHAGIHYFNNGENQIWGMNSGCLIDFKSYSFKYAKHYPSKPVISLALVDRGIPHFFPMTMDKSGRWTGHI